MQYQEAREFKEKMIMNQSVLQGCYSLLGHRLGRILVNADNKSLFRQLFTLRCSYLPCTHTNVGLVSDCDLLLIKKRSNSFIGVNYNSNRNLFQDISITKTSYRLLCLKTEGEEYDLDTQCVAYGETGQPLLELKTVDMAKSYGQRKSLKLIFIEKDENGAVHFRFEQMTKKEAIQAKKEIGANKTNRTSVEKNKPTKHKTIKFTTEMSNHDLTIKTDQAKRLLEKGKLLEVQLKPPSKSTKEEFKSMSAQFQKKILDLLGGDYSAIHPVFTERISTFKVVPKGVTNLKKK